MTQARNVIGLEGINMKDFATGAALGLLLGVVLNGCGLWEDHLLGFAIGPLWGMALAALFTRDTAPKDGNESGQS